ncbi:MAG: hypothetical protein EA425_01560 [Puniceicoccaceae bacterium]|nr:MAG: hypothetical protein EA425_01560 [Puniceicoccaceae bacterium]
MNCLRHAFSTALPTMRLKPLKKLTAVLLGLGLGASLLAQQQFQGYCARVKMEILQELTLERIGFEATLEVTNNAADDPITEFYAELTFETVEGEVRDASDLFFVRPPRVSGTNAADGSGIIGPTRTATVRWFIIPKPTAGGEDPRGTLYNVGVRLGGNLGGQPVPPELMYAIPDTITVRPEPQLVINYFLPRDVQGNDPFTETIESPIPFTLGVLVKNEGFGVARSLAIESQQPRIVENRQGLLLVAQLLGARVMDSPLDRASLTVNLGDIQPGETKKGAWDMIVSLMGEFVDFRATYTHASDLGGEETSLIKSLDAHFFAREVLNDQPGRDSILDFLAITDRNADLIPDALFESEGNVLPVNHLRQVEVLEGLGSNNTLRIGVLSDFEGWGYVRIDDPSQGRMEIKSAVRSDGKVINLRNVWTSLRYDRNTNRPLHRLHLFDLTDVGNYYEYAIEFITVEDDTPPETEILFAGDQGFADGVYFITRQTDVYFISESVTPVSMFYKIDDGEFRPALPFRFPELGTYQVTYYAQDTAGNIEEPKTTTVVVRESGPEFAGFDDGEGILLPGTGILSVRPGQLTTVFEAGANPLATQARVEIFSGVRAWPTLAGLPPSPTPFSGAELAVGGINADFYRYRIGSGAWSEEMSVAEPLVLSGLSGTVNLEVQARPRQGDYATSGGTVEASWTINASAPAVRVLGVPASPTAGLAAILTVESDDWTLYRWRAPGDFWRPQTPLSEPILLEGLLPGDQTIELSGLGSAGWTSQTNPIVVRWKVDPGYGAHYDPAKLVRSETFDGVQGSALEFAWDGTADDGRLLPSGWYTVRVTLSDSLGQETFFTRLVRIDALAGQPMVVSGAGAGARRPYARGGWAVWQDRLQGSWNIRALALEDELGEPLALTSGTLDQENAKTDGRIAVWQGRRPDGAWDIWMTDLTGDRTPERVTNSSAQNQIKPAVEWPYIVYQERSVTQSGGPWRLRAHHLETGETFTVDPTGTQSQEDPNIQSGRVVWRDERDVGPGEIYFSDLATGEVRRITQNSFGQFHPSIFGHWIVWQDNRDIQLDLFGHDLRTGREVRLTHTPGNETRVFAAGQWAVFVDESVGANLGNIHLMNLDSGRRVALTNTATVKNFPALANGYVLWQEGDGVGSEIRAARLPALQPVFHNANAVVVTEALAEAYPRAFDLLEAWTPESGAIRLTRYTTLLPVPSGEEALWQGGTATGTNFNLTPGTFLWVAFGEDTLLDLGPAERTPRPLDAGVNVLGFAGFPTGYTASRLMEQLGETAAGERRLRAVRMYDPRDGRWRVLENRGGEPLGPDFPIHEVALLFLDLEEPVPDWKPDPSL